MSIYSDAIISANSLQRYQDNKKLPEEFFLCPDNIAVTAEGIEDFSQQVRSLNGQAEMAILDDERFRVAAKLAGALSVGRFGYVRWLEIQEPMPEEAALEQTGVRHLDFYCSSFDAAQKLLDIRGVNFALHSLEYHHELRVIYDREGREFRLTDKHKSQIVENLINDGTARPLPQAA